MLNLNFFFEGEEEAGSPHLGDLFDRIRDLLAADLWLFCDGPVHQSRRPQLVFGARGIAELEITVYGAVRDLHSGHYGNWAPNPAFELARLLASMKDDDGRVTVAGFYDSLTPPEPAVAAAIAALPPFDDALRRELGLAATEANDAPYLERLLLPSLNVRGLASAGVGDAARNVVPATATASLDLRLVPGKDPRRCSTWSRPTSAARATSSSATTHDGGAPRPSADRPARPPAGLPGGAHRLDHPAAAWVRAQADGWPATPSSS